MAWRVEEEPAPTSTRGRPLSPKGERTRRTLLDAAEQVFGALGYHDASIVKITEAAAVSQGTFYIYYESKRQIFDELVADLNRRVRRAMSEGSRRGRTRAEAELRAVGLGDRLDHYPAELSGGEQQRVAIARALVPDPAILLADEPTGNLDAETGAHVADLLFKARAERGTTLVLVTHDVALANRSDRVVRLDSGRLVGAE